MNIIQRNFFRLLKCGVYGTAETLEPMSIHKWNKLYQMAQLHNVQPFIYQGLCKCKSQFFLKLTPQQWQQWETATFLQQQDNDEEELLRPYKLTNPLLNRQLQAILDDEGSDVSTRLMLVQIIRIARHILNEGLPLRLLIDLGVNLRDNTEKVNYDVLNDWLARLRFQQMAQLEGALLVDLFGFSASDIPFAGGDIDKKANIVARELAEYTSHPEEFYFSQSPDSIFVHATGGSALVSRVRRSARYMRFIPSEALTNFFASFAHSLTHIEE